MATTRRLHGHFGVSCMAKANWQINMNKVVSYFVDYQDFCIQKIINKMYTLFFRQVNAMYVQ